MLKADVALQELHVMPHIWAESRQEVCESFDWFRSYQGGVYFANNITKGYLLSGFPAKRDGFFHNGKLIISHGGGKAESKINLYALFPYNLGGKNITYAVLGVYNITHAWAEYETTKSGQKHVRFKFSFQWCKEQGEPWWHATKDKFTEERATLMPVVSSTEDTTCDASLENDNARTSESDYEEAMDISPDDERIPSTTAASPGNAAPKFSRRMPVKKTEFLLSERMRVPPDSKKNSGNDPIPDDLTFDEGFLQLQTLLPLDSGFRNINPSQPVTNPRDKITTLQAFTRGMHCIKCGRLSCRSKWEHWECANCQNVLAVNGAPRPVKVLKSLNPGVNFQWYFVGKDAGIIKSPVKPFGDHQTAGNVLTFSFPEGRGQIHHIQHNSMGPLVRLDTLFEEYQMQAADGSLPFRRWPLRSHKLRGSLLTNYFSQNCGVPYHYVGGTANTLTWEEAPTAVVKAKEFIEERTNLALNKQSEFNEVLSAAYMEKQKMSFHTDDEKGLGSVVAGLSLGSPALMHFRRRNVKHGPERKICLSIVLRHGDVLVMDGTGVQQYYEHMVEPINFRIAATARYINPDRK
ncbi:hypothetical protein LENED_004126 [Lentinula edodes]|uniref:Alpha-ketoglutarate-dependent dioxygenase AlkB-like domain-containing protein n=1 Tax=Lentinula edodes TaxID=5353 RepID=A0A1Q3E5G4_LENED|nr:hypothetical protein LENED_004126 [Lentinula edodes]